MKQLLSKSDYAEGIYDRIGKRPNVKQLLTHIDIALLPAYQENPFPTSANYVNHNAFFGFNLDSEVKINFDYRFSDIINAGVITYYSSEGPAELEWYSWGYSNVKIPVFDSNGQISVMYIRAYKMISQSAFTMNSAADMKGQSPGTFDLVLKFIAEDNKHLSSHNYKGVLPLYIKSWSTKDYQLPVRINIFID
ncbi:hypothetical protein BKM17_13055 [Pseudomonas syringae group genomosp. 3]|nr:hypothetical protein BKM17_13055 [Pseudomonas syringae group genomosp. 3]